jgi:hypothetical protein
MTTPTPFSAEILMEQEREDSTRYLCPSYRSLKLQSLSSSRYKWSGDHGKGQDHDLVASLA